MGYELSFNEADPTKTDNVFVIGQQLCEGSDVFELTPDIYNYIKKNKLESEVSSNVRFCKVYKMCESFEIDPKDFITVDKKLKVWAEIVDYHVTGGLSEFKERYIDNN